MKLLLKTKRWPSSFRCGFTLIEVLIALFILVTGLGACLILMARCLWAQEVGWNLMTASRHAAIVYERLQDCGSWQDVTAVDFDALVSKIDGTRLKEERIRIEPHTTNGPLVDVAITVAWTHHNKPQIYRLWARIYLIHQTSTTQAESEP